MFESIIVHYGEIGIKGKNRDFFEQKLMNNVRQILKENSLRVYKLFGRIACDLKENYDENYIIGALSKIPGIEYFFFAKKTTLDIDEITLVSLKLLENKKFEKFRVSTKRSNKQFKLTSLDVDVHLGQKILEKYDFATVDLKNPELILSVEVTEKNAFIYVDRFSGVGGLPIGSSGKVISSLSGGIDSPVSSYMMMKRGCNVVFVHIFNNSINGDQVLSKITNLVKQLTKFQLSSKLYVVPFAKTQREIIAAIEPRYRMIIYRRFMFRMINEISRREKAKAIVTGDSVGQVASQTLDNLNCIYDVAQVPVFSPLIGLNKEEIVNISKKIETYELSIIPYPDCCSFMIPKSPETNAKKDLINKLELKIENIKDLVLSCVDEAKIERFDFD